MMNLRLINSFCFFLLLVCPLTASAACPPCGSAELISEVNTHKFVWDYDNKKGRNKHATSKGCICKYFNKIKTLKKESESDTEPRPMLTQRQK